MTDYSKSLSINREELKPKTQDLINNSEKKKSVLQEINTFLVLAALLGIFYDAMYILFAVIFDYFDIYIFGNTIELNMKYLLYGLLPLFFSILFSSSTRGILEKAELETLGLTYKKISNVDIANTSIISKSAPFIMKNKIAGLYDGFNFEAVLIEKYEPNLNKLKNLFLMKIKLNKKYSGKMIIKHIYNKDVENAVINYPRIKYLYPELAQTYKLYTTNVDEAMSTFTVGFTNGLLELARKKNIFVNISIEDSFFNFQFEVSDNKITCELMKEVISVIRILCVKKYF